jgi:AcrR family transcriptional regulator
MDAQHDDIVAPSPKPRTARARPRGRGYASGDARRTRILNIALQEFAENGYRGTSLARIAERAELTQAGLLHHFRSKQELLVAVLDLRDRMDAEHLSVDVLPSGGEASLAKLVELAEHNRNIPGLVQLFTVLTGEAVTNDHPAHGWAKGRYAGLRAALTTSFEAGMASGELRADLDAPAVAAQVLAMMDGLQLQWLLDPDGVDMATLFTEYARDLLSRIRA